MQEIGNIGHRPGIDPNGAWADLVAGASDQTNQPAPKGKTSRFNTLPVRHQQGGKPFCEAYSTTHHRESAASLVGQYNALEPDFLAEASGTNRHGNTDAAVLTAAKNIGIALAGEFTHQPDNWQMPPDDSPLALPAGLPAITLAHAKSWAIGGFTYLNPRALTALMIALDNGPIVVSIGVEGATFGSRQEGVTMHQPKNPYQDFHKIMIADYDQAGQFFTIRDSLRVDGWQIGFDYELLSAESISETPLPANWRDLQAATQNALIPNNANYYGKQWNLQAEVVVAGTMAAAFHAFNNPAVLAAAGRFWQMYIRAIAYGGYSYTDVVNDCYHWRRTGQHIFDFNKCR